MIFTLFEKKLGNERKSKGVDGDLTVERNSQPPEATFIDTRGQEYTIIYPHIKWMNQHGLYLSGLKRRVSRSGIVEHVLSEWFCAFKEGVKNV